MRNTPNWPETTSREIASSIRLMQLQLLQKSTSNVKLNSNQRWWFGWPCLLKVLLISMFTKINKLFFKKHTWKNVSIQDYYPKYHSNGNYLFWSKHITQILLKNVWLEKISHLFLVSTVLQSSSNWNCMDCSWTKDIWKQLGSKKILIIWVRESNKK